MRKTEKIAVAVSLLFLFTAAGLTLQSRTDAPEFTLERAAVSPSAGVFAEAAEDGLININTADSEELCKLYGIGPVIAGRIIEYREEYGFFSNPADIIDVPGIGLATYEKMKNHITV